MHSYSVHFAIVLWSSVFICLHFSDNVNITNVIYVLSTQSFMLTLTETYSFSLFNTLSSCTMYTYTHTSLADAIFRISLVFYSNTRVLLHISFCEAHDFPFVVRSVGLRIAILLTSNKMQLKNAYSLFSKLQMYHNHFRFVTYVVQHSWDDLKTIHSIYLDFVPEVFNKQIKILKTTTTLRVHHEVDRNSTTVQFFQPLLNISGSFVDKLLNTGNFFDRNIGFWRCFCCNEIISIKFVFNRFILELKFDSQTMRIKAKAPEKMEFDAIQTEMIYQFEATSPLLFSPKIWWK